MNTAFFENLKTKQFVQSRAKARGSNRSCVPLKNYGPGQHNNYDPQDLVTLVGTLDATRAVGNTIEHFPGLYSLSYGNGDLGREVPWAYTSAVLDAPRALLGNNYGYNGSNYKVGRAKGRWRVEFEFRIFCPPQNPCFAHFNLLRVDQPVQSSTGIADNFTSRSQSGEIILIEDVNGVPTVKSVYCRPDAFPPGLIIPRPSDTFYANPRNTWKVDLNEAMGATPDNPFIFTDSFFVEPSKNFCFPGWMLEGTFEAGSGFMFFPVQPGQPSPTGFYVPNYIPFRPLWEHARVFFTSMEAVPLWSVKLRIFRIPRVYPLIRVGKRQDAPLRYTFQNISLTDGPSVTGPIVYTLFHGDGSSQVLPNDGYGTVVSHDYAAEGIKNVILQATTVDGRTISHTAPLNALVILVADFIYSPQFFDVRFVDRSFAAVTWNWDFGDGTAHSTIPDTTHTYAAHGTYNVTLTIGDGLGHFRSITKPVTW